jgi:hypothetical protein
MCYPPTHPVTSSASKYAAKRDFSTAKSSRNATKVDKLKYCSRIAAATISRTYEPLVLTPFILRDGNLFGNEALSADRRWGCGGFDSVLSISDFGNSYSKINFLTVTSNPSTCSNKKGGDNPKTTPQQTPTKPTNYYLVSMKTPHTWERKQKPKSIKSGLAASIYGLITAA